MSVGELAQREERPSWVQFETRTIEDKAASLEAGHYVGKDVDYALVTPPYSKDIYEQKVPIWFENCERNVRAGRLPQAHFDYYKKAYQVWKQTNEVPVDGIPIKSWPMASPTEIKLLLSINIRTVEDLAEINEEGLRRLGMGGRSLKNKAISYIKTVNDEGNKVIAENAQLKTENEQLKGTVTSLQEKIERLEQQIGNIADAKHKKTNTGVDGAAILAELAEEEQSDLEALRAEYKAVYGKDPHPAMREKGLQKKLGEHLKSRKDFLEKDTS